MKAADLDDREFLANVDRISRDGMWSSEVRWVMLWDLYECYPDAPPKVVAAKFRQLHKRGLLDGCTCGCRGDVELTDLGRAFLADPPPSPYTEKNAPA